MVKYLFLLAFVLSTVHGQSEEEVVKDLALAYVHPLTDLPPPHPKVSTSYIYPEFPDKKFVSGEVVKVLLGFHNGADEPLNVTTIMASLNAPHDFSLHIQNFTGIGYNRVVLPTQQASFMYMFGPDPNLDPREYLVAVTVFYSDLSNKNYSSTFFNGTAELVEPSSNVDTRTFFVYCLLSAAGILVVYVANKAFLSVKKNAGRKASKMERGTSDGQDAVNNDWIPDHVKLVEQKQKESFRKRQMGSDSNLSS